jgi:hypothetical protein
MDDQLKKQLMPAIVVFNLTVVAYLLFQVLYPIFVGGRGMMFGGFLTQALIGSGIGLVTGGITLGLMMLKKK